MNALIPDEEILYRLRLQDDKAFHCLMKKYHLLFLKHACQTFHNHRLDGISLDDIYIELCEHVYSICFKFDETKGAQFGRFIQTCVQTYCRNIVRRCLGKSYRMLSSSHSLDMQISEEGSLYLMDVLEQPKREYDPLIYARSESCLKALDEYLRTLPVLEQEIIIYKILGYSYREIADLCDCNVKKVDNTIQKVRKSKLIRRFVD